MSHVFSSIICKISNKICRGCFGEGGELEFKIQDEDKSEQMITCIALVKTFKERTREMVDYRCCLLFSYFFS